jgi:hypothetical protein
VGDLEYEKIEKQETGNQYPGPEDIEELHIEPPSSPGPVELERLEADKAQEKSYDFQLGVIRAPRDAVPGDEKPEVAHDQKAVQEMKATGDIGTLLTQIGREH